MSLYLDGDRNTGIYLGNAVYGVKSDEAAKVFGDEYRNTGFYLEWDRAGYEFEPGSVHYLYMYNDIPGQEESYIKKEVKIPGDLNTAGNIIMYLEFPVETVLDEGKKELGFSGWAVDKNSSSGTNIDRIEFYLDGPRGFGKLLGNADYGSARDDIATNYGSEFMNSGFRFKLDISGFTNGSQHSIYIYAISGSGQYQLIIKNINIAGELKRPDSNIFISTSLEDDPQTNPVVISGWLADIEYAVQRIVFVSDVNGNEDIFSMNLDGSDLKQLTDTPGADLYPAASSDGKRILYSSDVNGVWQIMVMDWDGSNKKQLTFNSERNGDPSWSFDDRYVYYEIFQDENWELYKMDINGSNVQRLTINPVVDDWHPFGHSSQYKILYEVGISGSYDLYIMNDDGTDIIKILDIPFDKRVPSMSPDGKYIIFQGKASGDKNYNIYIVQEDGKNLKKLTNNGSLDGHALISPDNQHIVYESDQKGKKQLFLMNFDGSDNKQLTFNTNYSSYMPDFIFIK